MPIRIVKKSEVYAGEMGPSVDFPTAFIYCIKMAKTIIEQQYCI